MGRRTELSVTIRVWHWIDAESLQLVLSMGHQEVVMNNDRGLICMEAQPEAPVTIQAGDVLGVFFPSQIIALPLPVLATSSQNDSLFKDQRSPVDVGAGSIVTLPDLLAISALALNINAEIGECKTACTNNYRVNPFHNSSVCRSGSYGKVFSNLATSD